MDQVHGRPALRLRGQALAAEQSAREAEHAGDGASPPGRDVERGHGALGEADQRQLMIRQAVALELGIEEGVEQRRHSLDPEQQRLRPPVAQREPLAAERRHVAGLGCVGRDERRIRQRFRERRRERDQIVAVGAHAMQQDDQLARRAAGAGRHPGSGQKSHAPQKSRRLHLVNCRAGDNHRRALPIASLSLLSMAAP